MPSLFGKGNASTEGAGVTKRSGASTELLLLRDSKPAPKDGPVKPVFGKKGAPAPVRKWVKVTRDGETTVITADKHTITVQLGVQLRDLRLLDPQLATSYPSAILVRDKALVVNLEMCKCIVTTDYVLVLNADEDSVISFIQELQNKLKPQALPRSAVFGSTPNLEGLADGLGQERGEGLEPLDDTPFELRVLEVVLDVVCSHLEKLTADLEASAHPALDALTQKVSTLNLERVRRIKNRMVRLTTRVETLREVLEKFLDDDSDMKDMNLTHRREEELQRQASLQHQASLQRDYVAPDGLNAFDRQGSLGPGIARGQSLARESTFTLHDSDSDDEETEQVEMLLEAYFMQIDNTYNKLQTLCEYIDDTEDYINIELDNHRNQLIQLEVLLTAATFCTAILTVVAGFFGMNINNHLEDNYTGFVLVCTITSGACIVMFVLFVWLCKRKKLIVF